jgi:hypothetical protein
MRIGRYPLDRECDQEERKTNPLCYPTRAHGDRTSCMQTPDSTRDVGIIGIIATAARGFFKQVSEPVPAKFLKAAPIPTARVQPGLEVRREASPPLPTG